MTIAELIKELQKYPSDAEVTRVDREYGYWPISKIEYFDENAVMFNPSNSVKIS